MYFSQPYNWLRIHRDQGSDQEFFNASAGKIGWPIAERILRFFLNLCPPNSWTPEGDSNINFVYLMRKSMCMICRCFPRTSSWFIAVGLAGAMVLFGACRGRQEIPVSVSDGTELPIRPIPGFFSAAESYFSPDEQRLILRARLIEQEAEYHVYTVNLDGTDIRRINSLGMDACSYYFPDGSHIVFASTRDNRHLPQGDYSDPNEYPAGAEIYTCRPDGSGLRRITRNENYEAEASLAPDGEWILFGRMSDKKIDLWRMRPDGSEEFRITNTPSTQEGTAFYLPDSKTIIYHAWSIHEQGQQDTPMSIYTMLHDGTDIRQITYEEAINRTPHPAPDGVHIVFAKLLPPYNFEIFLMNMVTGEQIRLTYNNSFDGFPSFSPDGHTISFSSARNLPADSNRTGIYLMDVESLLPL
jgi:Tol biopolymer transport system component